MRKSPGIQRQSQTGKHWRNNCELPWESASAFPASGGVSEKESQEIERAASWGAIIIGSFHAGKSREHIVVLEQATLSDREIDVSQSLSST